MYLIIYVLGMLSAGWEVCIVKNCDRGLRSQFFTIWTHPKLVNNLFFFPSSQTKKKITEKNSCKRYCDRGQR